MLVLHFGPRRRLWHSSSSGLG